MQNNALMKNEQKNASEDNSMNSISKVVNNAMDAKNKPKNETETNDTLEQSKGSDPLFDFFIEKCLFYLRGGYVLPFIKECLYPIDIEQLKKKNVDLDQFAKLLVRGKCNTTIQDLIEKLESIPLGRKGPIKDNCLNFKLYDDRWFISNFP